MAPSYLFGSRFATEKDGRWCFSYSPHISVVTFGFLYSYNAQTGTVRFMTVCAGLTNDLN